MPSIQDLAKQKGVTLKPLNQMNNAGGITLQELAKRKGIELKPVVEEKPKTFLQKTGEVIKGAGKGLLSTLSGASAIGENMLKTTGRIITPKSLEKTFGFQKEDLSSAKNLQNKIENNLGIQTGSLTTPINNLQKIGFTLEQIAEFFVPGGASLKVGKTAEAAMVGGKLLKGITKFGATGLTEAGLSAGQTIIQKGEIDSDTKKAALYGLVTPTVGSIGGKLLKGIGNTTSEILGKTTGAGKTSIVEVFNNPNVIKFAREAGSDTDSMLRQIAEQAESSLQSMKIERGKMYRQQLEKLDLGKKELSNVLYEVKNKLKDLSDDLDTIVEGENVMNKAIKDVEGWADDTAYGMDKLKQRLGSYSQQLIGAGKTKAKRIVDELRISVTKGLKDNVKGYGEMTKSYEETSDMINDITHSLSLGNKKQTETAVRKFMQSVQRDDDTRRQFLEVLSKQKGNDLVGKIAGSLLGRVSPRGLSGLLIGGGAGIASLSNPSTIVGLLPVMLMTSPRIVAEFTNIVGRITKPMIESKLLSVDLQRAVRQLLLEMRKESE